MSKHRRWAAPGRTPGDCEEEWEEVYCMECGEMFMPSYHNDEMCPRCFHLNDAGHYECQCPICTGQDGDEEVTC